MIGEAILHTAKLAASRFEESRQFWRDVFLTQLNRHGSVATAAEEANLAVSALNAKFKVSED